MELIIPDTDLNAIRQAVTEAEKKMSAELRVLIEETCKGDLLDRAAFAFHKLNMHQTAQSNGVLIYVSVNDHRCAIIGDSGIHQRVEPDFWKTIVDEMIVFFSAGQLKEGILHAINRVSLRLAEHFPPDKNDRNELPDEVVTQL